MHTDFHMSRSISHRQQIWKPNVDFSLPLWGILRLMVLLLCQSGNIMRIQMCHFTPWKRYVENDQEVKRDGKKSKNMFFWAIL
jgi:hypothetical protein